MMSPKLSPLYITYDGLLDPLGASQILPYLKGIVKSQPGMVVLSFEKPERTRSGGASMTAVLNSHDIKWKPLRFTSGMGVLGKIWDLSRMYYWGLLLALLNDVHVIHTRGHPPAQVGLLVKRLIGVKLIFDFRGLWVDERVDKGGWDLSRWFHRVQYHYFKRTERTLLSNADQVVVLTQAVVNEVVKLGALPSSKVTVIPCCADFDHFPLATIERQALARESAGIPIDAKVLGYLGSVGRMYMLDHFFRLFEIAAAQRTDIYALVITLDVAALNKVMKSVLPSAFHSRVHIISATRNEVANLIPAMNLLVSFIQSSYARMAASPTKLAECLAEGIPVICNDGVGDVAEQIKKLGAGVIVDPTSEGDVLASVSRLEEICSMGGIRLRNAAREFLGLEVAIARYQTVYSKLY